MCLGTTTLAWKWKVLRLRWAKTMVHELQHPHAPMVCVVTAKMRLCGLMPLTRRNETSWKCQNFDMKLLGLIAKQFQAMQRETYAYQFVLLDRRCPCATLGRSCLLYPETRRIVIPFVKIMLYGFVCDDQHARTI
jgi:hypothetical protein